MKNNQNNRHYKDSVFVDLFAKDIDAKKNFLSLYNALHGTDLKLEETKIEPVRLEQVLYMSFYNDISMLVNGRLVVLVEHQSTINENMPLRFLEYITHIYEQIISPRSKFQRRRIKIPRPEFYVFYNGTEDYADNCELCLSESFESATSEDGIQDNKIPLELYVKVYNINKCKGNPILEKCRPIEEYGEFVSLVQDAQKKEIPNAFDAAIKQAIEKGILSDYLRRKASEVINMLLTEYDYETDIEVQREEAAAIAREEGIQTGLEKGKIETARNMKQLGIALELIAKATGLSLEQIESL